MTKAASATGPMAFIDFEASGLGPHSWPIEVGWSFEDGVTESFLICPAPAWSMDAWAPEAERIHGITPKMLNDLGVDASIACDRLAAALQGRRVFSDAPDWDSFWMMQLFKGAGRRPLILIEDFSLAMPPLSIEARRDLIARADRMAPRRHRAAEDALHLQTIFRLATE